MTRTHALILASMVLTASQRFTSAFTLGPSVSAIRHRGWAPQPVHRGGVRFLTLKAQSPKEIVSEAISSNSVMVFSKSHCPYCAKAKAALDSVGAKYKVMELDQRDDGPEIQQVFVELTGAKTVPRVFIKGKFIGGGDDMQRLAQSGELAKMV